MQHGALIFAQKLLQTIASSPGDEIPCSGGPFQINQQHYQGDVSLLNDQRIGSRLSLLNLETYMAFVVGVEIFSSWHGEVLEAQAVAAHSYAMAHLARPARRAYHLGD